MEDIPNNFSSILTNTLAVGPTGDIIWQFSWQLKHPLPHVNKREWPTYSLVILAPLTSPQVDIEHTSSWLQGLDFSLLLIF